ncbi:MAG: hypothetical protein CM1200mP3_16150 [Chloroflexota bacterium]|nr:MAG: hypothetical protein CM1200mP3_16150 [Chloroflexota bacterium]
MAQRGRLQVSKNEPVAEIETDKAVVEFESEVDGNPYLKYWPRRLNSASGTNNRSVGKDRGHTPNSLDTI